MAETARPSTPPQPATTEPGVLSRSSLTPEQVKQLEINRLKAKALRTHREASSTNGNNVPPTLKRSGSSNIAAGAKRPASLISTSNVPSTSRDARATTISATNGTHPNKPKPSGFRPLEDLIQPARNFSKYVEYDFSKMNDTKGGFMTIEDDPHNRAFHSKSEEEKPSHMTLKEWERLQLLRKLRDQRAGPYEPGISILNSKDSEAAQRVCRECGSLEIDWQWAEQLRCCVCSRCKEEMPDKYSLLTKTEAKEDYLLTDPELRDEDLLPHIEKPNPREKRWNNMMLYLRYQVEDYAFSDQKWGSSEKLDEEYARREEEKRRRKEGKFQAGLSELKKKTRVEAYRRGLAGQQGKSAGFGTEVGRKGKHEHSWGRSVQGDSGVEVKRCVECGMEVEELEF